MAKRQGQARTRLLAVLALALLAADLIVLAFLVAPLRASQHQAASSARIAAQPAQTFLEERLILPTLDPAKPRFTRTPTPTVTAWLPWTATVSPTSWETEAPFSTSATEASPVQAVGAAAMPTPTPAQPATRPTDVPGLGETSPTGPGLAVVPSPVATRPVVAGPAVTPIPASRPPAGRDPQAESTPVPPQPLDPSQLPPSIIPGDESAFLAYARSNYSSIGGQDVEILAVTFESTDDGLPRITLQMAPVDTASLLAATVKERYWLGSRLLEDARLYFDTQSCAILIVGEDEAADSDSCSNDTSCCTIGEPDEGRGFSPVIWTYVSGTTIDGSDDLQCAY